MLYAIAGEDAPDSLAKRHEARPAHLARLEQLQNEGRLVLAGPHPAIDAGDPGPAGFTGSLIVAEFPSLEDAPELGGRGPVYGPRRICAGHGKAVPPGAAVTTPTRLDLIRQRLDTALSPSELEVTDESHLHKGHAGARDGRGHFRVRIVSGKFAGLRSLARHRLVYDAFGTLMQSDIHALTVTALTPQEPQ